MQIIKEFDRKIKILKIECFNCIEAMSIFKVKRQKLTEKPMSVKLTSTVVLLKRASILNKFFCLKRAL